MCHGELEAPLQGAERGRARTGRQGLQEECTGTTDSMGGGLSKTSFAFSPNLLEASAEWDRCRAFPVTCQRHCLETNRWFLALGCLSVLQGLGLSWLVLSHVSSQHPHTHSSIYMYISIHPHTHPSIYSPTHSPIHLSIHTSIYLTIHIFIHSSICQSIHLFIP